MVTLSRYMACELVKERGNIKYTYWTRATRGRLKCELLRSCSDIQVGLWEQHQLYKPAECICRDSVG
jgi:hypothetical protein